MKQIRIGPIIGSLWQGVGQKTGKPFVNRPIKVGGMVDTKEGTSSFAESIIIGE